MVSKSNPSHGQRSRRTITKGRRRGHAGRAPPDQLHEVFVLLGSLDTVVTDTVNAKDAAIAANVT